MLTTVVLLTSAFFISSAFARDITVRKGDTLSAIAKRELGCGCKNHQLMIARLNGISNLNKIRSGTRLKLPSSGSSRPPANAGGAYTIRSGDTYSALAKKWWGNAGLWLAIRNANPGINEARLRVGQRIRVPARPSSGQRTRSYATSGGAYVIRSGDSYTALAKRWWGNAGLWRSISRANPGVDAKRLQIGQRIRVPAKPSSSTKFCYKPPFIPIQGCIGSGGINFSVVGGVSTSFGNFSVEHELR